MTCLLDSPQRDRAILTAQSREHVVNVEVVEQFRETIGMGTDRISVCTLWDYRTAAQQLSLLERSASLRAVRASMRHEFELL